VYIKDALKIAGCGDVIILANASTRCAYSSIRQTGAAGLPASAVVGALQEQNIQVAAGQIGQPPSPTGQAYQVSVRAVGRLSEASEFDNIILRTGADGTLIRLKDVGRAELGAEDYGSLLRFNGHDAVGMGVTQLPGANALDVDKAAKEELVRLSKNFPPGLKVAVAFDTTTVIGESIRDVMQTLAEAIILVVIVIYIFLQDWRSTLIPAITIPVSLVGTFIFVKALGFSINTLTLFGITPARG
jgi:HAE1 family hydrophobic/amphiphilic exporter-1